MVNTPLASPTCIKVYIIFVLKTPFLSPPKQLSYLIQYFFVFSPLFLLPPKSCVVLFIIYSTLNTFYYISR